MVKSQIVGGFQVIAGEAWVCQCGYYGIKEFPLIFTDVIYSVSFLSPNKKIFFGGSRRRIT